METIAIYILGFNVSRFDLTALDMSLGSIRRTIQLLGERLSSGYDQLRKPFSLI
ncbi:hypothetical protein [Desulfosarcina variabilis]|uniref:hypothetical protein n=1 Tax=Desulfosarcina variabilis TaxID=2300 RepID=UPI003AFB685A